VNPSSSLCVNMEINAFNLSLIHLPALITLDVC